MLPLVMAKNPKKAAMRAVDTAVVEVSNESWLTKHHPRSLDDVKIGVHWSYENRVREWLIRACRAHAEQAETRDFRPHVLALCGPSGCGKSTLVEVLCKELDFDIVVWHDDMWEFQSNSGGGARERGGVGSEGRGGQGRRDWERGTARLSLEERRSKTEEMESFVLQSKYPKLALHGSKTSSGARAGPAGSASGGAAASNVVHARNSKSRSSDSFLPAFRRIILIHDPPHLLVDQAHSQPHASSNYAKQQQRLGELLTSFTDPVVLIVSDVGGKDDVMYAKKRCLPTSVQNLVKLEDIYQAGSTPKNLFKVLSAIISKEKLHDVPNALLEGIAESSGGDIRHAVLQLEYVVRSFGSGGETSFAKSSLCASVIGGYEDGTGADGQSSSGMSSSGHAGAGSKRKGAPGIKLSNPTDLHPRVQLVRGEDSDGALLDMTAAAAAAASAAGSHLQDGGGGRVGKPRIERRDARYSSLTSAGKLVRAALDSHGQLGFDCDQVVYKSELEPELLIPFVQFNVIKSLELTASLESRCNIPLAKAMGSDADGFEPKSSVTDPSGSQTVSTEDSSSKRQALESTNGSQLPASASSIVPTDLGQSIEPMQQVSSALAVCSDIEAMLSVKYDPSALIDRASTIFPGEYACSLLARVGCAARGVGSAERIATAKALGHKGTFNPIFRPKAFDLPRQRARVEASMCELQAQLLLCTVGGRQREENGSLPSSLTAIMTAPRVYSTAELSTTLEPYLQMHCPPHSGTKWPNATTSTIPSAILRSLDALRQLRRASNGDDSEYTIPRMASEAVDQIATHTSASDADQELEQQQYARSGSQATSQQGFREDAANEDIEDVEDIDDPDR